MRNCVGEGGVSGLAGGAITAVAAKVAASATSPAARGVANAVSCAVNSFVPGTAVLLADGTTVPIEDIQLGDEVLATDPETGETGPQPVTALITGDGTKDLTTVTIVGQDGDAETIVATDGHPFWVPDLGRWVDAGDLLPGEWLSTSAGTRVQITAIRHDHREQTVHNLTVANTHTYYVAASADAVLVHNCGAKAPSGLPDGYSSFSAAKRGMGSPGQGNVFDHVVEQSQIKRSGFAPEEIHNPFNMNPVTARTNQIKANYYSSKQPFTSGQTVRDWLTGQSFADQYSFGMDTLIKIRSGTIQ